MEQDAHLREAVVKDPFTGHLRSAAPVQRRSAFEETHTQLEP